MNLRFRSALFVALAASPLAARADELIGNLTLTSATDTILAGSNRKAMGFAVPDGAAYTLDRATLSLTVSTGNVPEVSLFSSIGGNPGSLLSALVGQTSGSGLQNYDFAPAASLPLEAGTSYFLVVQNAGTGNLLWSAFDGSGGGAPTGIATHTAARTTAVGGGFTSSRTNNLYRIAATPVPEPASLAALGLGAVAVLRRRKRG